MPTTYSIRGGPKSYKYDLIDVDGDFIIDTDGDRMQLFTDPGYYAPTTYSTRIIP